MKKYLLLIGVLFLSYYNLHAQCDLGETEVFIEIDGSSGFANGEIYWRLYDDEADTLVFETFAGYLTSGAVESDNFCLQDGINYRFEAYDSFGDGWNDAFYTISYSDGFIFNTSMPDNGSQSPDDLEETFVFTIGDRPGDDCSVTKEISSGEIINVNTALYSNNYVSDPLFDSGNEAIFTFTPLTTEEYGITLSEIPSLDRGSIQLFDNCYDGTPNRIAFDSTGVSNNILEIFETLNAGSTYYLVVSNNGADTGIDAIEGDLEVFYSGSPLNTNCTNALSITIDGDSIYSRTQSNSPAQNPVISVQSEYGDTYNSYGDSLFYEFTLASPEDIVIEIGDYDIFNSVFIELEKKESCGEEAETFFKRVAPEDVKKVFAFSYLESGNYRLKVFPPAFIEDEFNVSLKSQASKAVATNQDCSNALNLNVFGYDESTGPSSITSISYFNSTDSGLGAPCAQDSIYSSGTADVWVKAVVPGSGDLLVQTFGEVYDVLSSPDQALETRFFNLHWCMW